MFLAIKKPLAVGVSLLFFSQTALGFQAESSFWADRRRKIEKPNTAQASPQLASLPQSLAGPGRLDPASLARDLPSLSPAISNIQKWGRFHRKEAKDLSPVFSRLINSIPLIYGSIQEVYDSGARHEPPVLLLQDVHLNSEAQSNIAGILQELIDQKQIGVVGVEGAFGPIDFTKFRAFESKKILKEVMDLFVNKNLMAAPSYVGITSPAEPPLFLGIDDKPHYDANVKAYLDSLTSKKRISNELSQTERELAKAKATVFSPELKRFDDLRAAYAKGDVGIGAYVKKLSKYGFESDFAIDQFLEAYGMEQSLDFNEVDRERHTVLENLTKVLKEEEISGLLAQSLAYRMGRIGFGDYYQELKSLCESHGISLRKTPAFDEYVRYVLLSDGIKADQLFASVKALENRVLGKLAASENERSLASRSEHFSLTQKLVEFSLTPNEWDEYKKGRHSREDGNNENFTPYEKFYEEADVRSHKLVGNLLGNSTQGNRAFVIGGFHTPQIAQLLRDQKISFVIVSPKITKVESGSGTSYLSVFAREKTPLDKLLAGEKLFINPTVVNVGNGTSLDMKALAAPALAGSQNPLLQHQGEIAVVVGEIDGHSVFGKEKPGEADKVIDRVPVSEQTEGVLCIQSPSLFQGATLNLGGIKKAIADFVAFISKLQVKTFLQLSERLPVRWWLQLAFEYSIYFSLAQYSGQFLPPLFAWSWRVVGLIGLWDLAEMHKPKTAFDLLFSERNQKLSNGFKVAFKFVALVLMTALLMDRSPATILVNLGYFLFFELLKFFAGWDPIGEFHKKRTARGQSQPAKTRGREFDNVPNFRPRRLANILEDLKDKAGGARAESKPFKRPPRVIEISQVLNQSKSPKASELVSTANEEAVQVPSELSWYLTLISLPNPETRAKGFFPPSTPWARNNLRLVNGFWRRGPEIALGLVSRGVRFFPKERSGVLAPNSFPAGVDQPIPFLPLSTSRLPYGGLGWSSGEVILYFDFEVLKNQGLVASQQEVAELRKLLPIQTFLNDKQEVVVKNIAPWSTVKWIFLNGDKFREYEEFLRDQGLLSKTFVFGLDGNVAYYYIGNSPIDRFTTRTIPTSILDPLDNEMKMLWVSRLAITDVAKREYLSQQIEGVARGSRILDQVPKDASVFTPEEIAEKLDEDVDIVIDLLASMTDINVEFLTVKDGRRNAHLKQTAKPLNPFRWDTLTDEWAKPVSFGKGLLFGETGKKWLDNFLTPGAEEFLFTTIPLLLSLATGSFWIYGIFRLAFILAHLVGRARAPDQTWINYYAQHLLVPALVSLAVVSSLGLATHFDLKLLSGVVIAVQSLAAWGIHAVFNWATDGINWSLEKGGWEFRLGKANLGIKELGNGQKKTGPQQDLRRPQRQIERRARFIGKVLGNFFGLSRREVGQIIRETTVTVSNDGTQAFAGGKGINIDLAAHNFSTQMLLTIASEMAHRCHQILAEKNQGKAFTGTVAEAFDALGRVAAAFAISQKAGEAELNQLRERAQEGALFKDALKSLGIPFDTRITIDQTKTIGEEGWISVEGVRGGKSGQSHQILSAIAVRLLAANPGLTHDDLMIRLASIARDLFVTRSGCGVAPFSGNHLLGCWLAQHFLDSQGGDWRRAGRLFGRSLKTGSSVKFSSFEEFLSTMEAEKKAAPVLLKINPFQFLFTLRVRLISFIFKLFKIRAGAPNFSGGMMNAFMEAWNLAGNAAAEARTALNARINKWLRAETERTLVQLRREIPSEQGQRIQIEIDKGKKEFKNIDWNLKFRKPEKFEILIKPTVRNLRIGIPRMEFFAFHRRNLFLRAFERIRKFLTGRPTSEDQLIALFGEYFDEEALAWVKKKSEGEINTFDQALEAFREGRLHAVHFFENGNEGEKRTTHWTLNPRISSLSPWRKASSAAPSVLTGATDIEGALALLQEDHRNLLSRLHSSWPDGPQKKPFFLFLARLLARAPNLRVEEVKALVQLVADPRVDDQAIDLIERFIDRKGMGGLLRRAAAGRIQFVGAMGELLAAEQYVDRNGGKSQAVVRAFGEPIRGKGSDGKSRDVGDIDNWFAKPGGSETSSVYVLAEVKNHGRREQAIDDWIKNRKRDLEKEIENLTGAVGINGSIHLTEKRKIAERKIAKFVFAVRDVGETAAEKEKIRRDLNRHAEMIQGRLRAILQNDAVVIEIMILEDVQLFDEEGHGIKADNSHRPFPKQAGEPVAPETKGQFEEAMRRVESEVKRLNTEKIAERKKHEQELVKTVGELRLQKPVMKNAAKAFVAIAKGDLALAVELLKAFINGIKSKDMDIRAVFDALLARGWQNLAQTLQRFTASDIRDLLQGMERPDNASDFAAQLPEAADRFRQAKANAAKEAAPNKPAQNELPQTRNLTKLILGMIQAGFQMAGAILAPVMNMPNFPALILGGISKLIKVLGNKGNEKPMNLPTTVRRSPAPGKGLLFGETVNRLWDNLWMPGGEEFLFTTLVLAMGWFGFTIPLVVLVARLIQLKLSGQKISVPSVIYPALAVLFIPLALGSGTILFPAILWGFAFWNYAAIRLAFVILHLVGRPRAPGQSWKSYFAQHLLVPALVSLAVISSLSIATHFDPNLLSAVTISIQSLAAWGIHSLGNLNTDGVNWFLKKIGRKFQLKKASLSGPGAKLPAEFGDGEMGMLAEEYRHTFMPSGSPQQKKFIERLQAAAINDPAGLVEVWKTLSERPGNPAIRLIWELIPITRAHRDATPYVIKLLLDRRYRTSSYYLTAALAELLGEMGDPRAIPPLIDLSAEKEFGIVLAAVRALGSFGDEALKLLHERFWVQKVHEPIIEVLGLIGNPLSEPLLREAYPRASHPDLRANILQSIGHLRNAGSVPFLLEILFQNKEADPRAAALQALAEVTTERNLGLVLPVLEQELRDSNAPLHHQFSALFSILFLETQFRKAIPESTKQAVKDFFLNIRLNKKVRPANEGEMVAHATFSDLDELIQYIDIKDELGFAFIPMPELWDFPEHQYEFYMQPVENGVAIGPYDGNGPIRSNGRTWPITGAMADEFLKGSGLLGGEGILLVLRGNKRDTSAPPILSKIAKQLAHTHPRRSTEGESDNDQGTFKWYEHSLATVRRSLNHPHVAGSDETTLGRADLTYPDGKKPTANLKDLQRYFGRFGQTLTYRRVVGSLLEEFGLLAYPLIFLLFVFRVISAKDFRAINRRFGTVNRSLILGRKTLFLGYRGLPLAIGSSLLLISPIAALVGVILASTITGLLFIARHERGERAPPILVSIVDSIAVILPFAGFPIWLSLLPLLFHPALNTIQTVREKAPLDNFPLERASGERLPQEENQPNGKPEAQNIVLKLENLSSSTLITVKIAGIRCIFDLKKPSINAYDQDGFPLQIDLTEFARAILQAERGPIVPELSAAARDFLIGYIQSPGKPSMSLGNAQEVNLKIPFAEDTLNPLTPLDAPPAQTVTVLQGEYTVAKFGVNGIKYLQTDGLGPCVALCLWDRTTRTGFLAHIDGGMAVMNSLIPSIKQALSASGANLSGLKAFVVGGDDTMSEDLLSMLEDLIRDLGITDVQSCTRKSNIQSPLEDGEIPISKDLLPMLENFFRDWGITNTNNHARKSIIQSLVVDIETGNAYSVADFAKFSPFIDDRTEALLSSVFDTTHKPLKFLEPRPDIERGVGDAMVRASVLASILIKIVQQNWHNRAQMLIKALELFMAQERVQSLNIGERLASAPNDPLIPGTELAKALRDEIRKKVADRELKPQDVERLAPILAAILSLALSKAEVQRFLVSIDNVSYSAEIDQTLDNFEWLAGNMDDAVEQAGKAISGRREEATAGKNAGRLILVADGQKIDIEKLKQEVAKLYGTALNGEQIQIVDGQNHRSVWNLLRAVNGPAMTNEALAKVLTGRVHRFRVRNDIALPPDFFKLADSGLDQATKEALQKSFDVILIINALQAVRIDSSNLDAFETFRKILLQA